MKQGVDPHFISNDIALCPFMSAFYARHPEYADAIEGTLKLRGA